MKLLHVQRADGISGSERHLLALLPALAARGHDVRMVVLERPGGERFSDAMASTGVAVGRVAAGRGAVMPGDVIGLVREIRGFLPDLLHTHLIHADVTGSLAARFTGVPHVLTVHSTAAPYRRRVSRAAAAAAGRRAVRVIAISDHVARFLAERRIADATKIRTIHYGIDSEQWSPRPVPVERFGWSEGEVVFLLASRLVPDKGHHTVLHALAAALPAAPGLRLAVAGDGPLREPLVALAEQLGIADRVRFLGFAPDMRDVISAVDVVLFPTGEGFGEGFGLVNLEAMAMGRPVVGSRVASVPEIVVDGVTGLLVPPEELAPLAEAMVRLATDVGVRTAMGEAGRARAEEAFSLERMVDRTAALYDELHG